MRYPAERNIRPALWGFFICLAIAGILYVIGIFIPPYIRDRWDAEFNARKSQNEQLIRNTFQSRVDQLKEILDLISADTSLTANTLSSDLQDARIAFQKLKSYKLSDDQTIDIVDSSGNSYAWNGPSITNRYADILNKNSRGIFTHVSQHGLRTYITVGKYIVSDKYYLLVSEPLELNSPISNRFVRRTSLSEDLSQKLKVKVALRLPNVLQDSGRQLVVPILNTENNEIGQFVLEEKTAESEISSYTEVFSILKGIFIALCGIFAVYAGITWVSNKKEKWLTVLTSIILIWAIRFLWRIVDFPGVIINSRLFNPKVYSSPFACGLSSSLGELILSAITIAISAWLLFKYAVLTNREEINLDKPVPLTKRIYSVSLTGVIGLLMLWMFRGFSEAIRSFVFDSTIRFNNPSEILLDVESTLMLANVLLLGGSLILISTALILKARKILTLSFDFSAFSIRVFYISSLLLCTPLFIWIDKTPQSQYASILLFIIFSIVCMELLSYWNNLKISEASVKWRTAVIILLGAFFVGVPVMHQKLQQREQKETEAVAKELLRPSDNWLSFIVLDGIRTAVESIRSEYASIDIAEAGKTNLAFVLWTKTLLGKEGYNSALVLYDKEGEEADRFVVGMSNPEQKEILTQVFEGEENAVHFIGRTGRKKLGKLYGAWIAIRDINENFKGSLALLLSEQQRSSIYTQETEALRQFGDRFENSMVREIAFHEYQIDALEFSTGIKLNPDNYLSPDISSELQKTASPVLWKDIKINDTGTRTVFVRSADSPGKIVSISLEKLDIRWELFNYLKEFFVCLGILAAAGIYMSFKRRKQINSLFFGFKGKLFLGFACITLLPLTILSYYNRQLVSEQVQEQVESALYRELYQLQERIGTYVVDEEDFILGVNNDFCEALAGEYGADFSIYRDASIHASSLSELYRAGFLDERLNGDAFAASVLGNMSYFLIKEKIGSVEYFVGYSPITINGTNVGVLAVPTLNREKQMEAELAKRNAYVFGIYAIVFGIALIGGGLLALRFADPIRQLTIAAKDVSEGNLAVRVDTRSNDEIGILAGSFNEMVQKLKESREELSKHERESAWKEMAKQIAHEIRNPLTPIKLSIQHLRQAFKDKAPDREEILQRVTQTVIDQIETLSRIATEFSSFARIPESKYEQLIIDDLLAETINLFREVKEISFIHTPSSSSAFIIADRDQLRGVFINIFRNAIQAIKKTGTITSATCLEKHLCIIRISDTGPGIPEELRTKIFEPNFSTKTEGMGLGLAIARRVIEDHGGTITCLSEEGKGTTFEIRLPARQ